MQVRKLEGDATLDVFVYILWIEYWYQEPLSVYHNIQLHDEDFRTNQYHLILVDLSTVQEVPSISRKIHWLYKHTSGLKLRTIQS